MQYITRFDVRFLFPRVLGSGRLNYQLKMQGDYSCMYVSGAQPFNGWVRLSVFPFQSLASSDM